MFKHTRSEHEGVSIGRSRAVHVVVAAALAAAAVTAIGVAQSVGAAGSGTPSSFVPMTPCRLLDTRPGLDNVGTRSTPLGPVTTFTATARGTNGRCTIPASATGLSMNVAAVNPSAASFLAVFPSDAPLPLAASLNWVANQPPTPNAVTAALSADGKLSFYNLAGTVDIVVDVVGYYEPSSAGPPGPAGATGATGATGANGVSAVGGVDFSPAVADVALLVGVNSVIATMTVNAPAAGFVVVNAATSLNFNGATLAVICDVSTAATLPDGSFVTTATTSQFGQYATTRGFAVAAGNTTFNLVCTQVDAGPSNTAFNSYITGVFSATRL